MPRRKRDKVKFEDLTIGDRVLINLHHGRMEQGIIKAITPIPGGAKYQVDFGQDRTATIRDWQIIEKLGRKRGWHSSVGTYQYLTRRVHARLRRAGSDGALGKFRVYEQCSRIQPRTV